MTALRSIFLFKFSQYGVAADNQHHFFEATFRAAFFTYYTLYGNNVAGFSLVSILFHFLRIFSSSKYVYKF